MLVKFINEVQFRSVVLGPAWPPKEGKTFKVREQIEWNDCFRDDTLEKVIEVKDPHIGMFITDGDCFKEILENFDNYGVCRIREIIKFYILINEKHHDPSYIQDQMKLMEMVWLVANGWKARLDFPYDFIKGEWN